MANDLYSLTLSDLLNLKEGDSVSFNGNVYAVHFAQQHRPEWIYFRRLEGKQEKFIRYGKEGWAAGTPEEWGAVIRAKTARS